MHHFTLATCLCVVLTGLIGIVFAQQTPGDTVGIVSHNSFLDQAEYLHVVGEVQNNSTSSIEFVQVIGTYYDTNNEVVGTAFTYTQPDKLPPGDIAPFNLILTSASVPMSEVDHYSLKLTWREPDSTTEMSSDEVTTGSVGVPQSQQAVTCGSDVAGTVTLVENLNCTGDGLLVKEEDATTINLNGFSIFGPGADSSSIGIGIEKDNVVIKGPGIISGFQAGILATGTNQPNITSTILQNNQIGVFLTSNSGVRIIENIVKNNNIGLAAQSDSGITAQNNLIDNNTMAGITFVDASKSNLVENSIGGSQNGMFLDAQSTGNTMSQNKFHSNVVDINNANGLAPTINQNTYSNNNCKTSNPSGLCSSIP